ncbi:ABC transporter substrate-binding protein [Paenibacillus larvae]|uniref:ABC transporter substrate-binding protein n=1 Tax=Paenibacillus larvae TaxID=1464 RepID=UPI00289004EC|nr:ABC transporter substrate-binding protein [Paenibacillus larvae]MDT2194219.1 ABC transporter substrate-binding protein [Paenibacillus larvae]
MKNNTSKWLGTALLAVIIGLTGCSSGKSGQGASSQPSPEAGALEKVKVVLDWTPNTNHTGLYVAKEKGYFKEQGLDVDIIPPGRGADTMIASGSVPFGISIQESITQARTQGVPIVSLAAIIQHNTSGFAAPAGKNIKSPKDFEGKTYGGFGAPSEKAVIDSIMRKENADIEKVKIVNIGEADYFTATKRDIDFAWIFYAWTGIEAELKNEPLDMIYVNKYSEKLDYYTPVIATNEDMIKNKPETVKKFMTAVSQGYQFAIDKPEEAADILLKCVPDLDKELVQKSQKWLSPRYQDDAPRWGEQKLSVWQNYSDWMVENKLLEKPLEAEKAFTNDFLPAASK